MADTQGLSGVSPSQGAYNNNPLGSNQGGLTMNDFFTLLAAQLSNQDMYNTMDDTQFMAQMAQFSMVQALSEMSQLSMMSYGTSMIGKEATVAAVDSDGYLDKTTGIVEGVNFFNGQTQIVIDGQTYGMSSIMELKEPKIILPQNPENDGKGKDEGDGGDHDETEV